MSDDLLAVAIARLGAHVQDGHISASRVERAVRRLASPTITFDDFVSRLSDLGVSVDGDISIPSDGTAVIDRGAKDRFNPISEPDPFAAAVTAARMHMERDRDVSNLGRRLLTSQEEVGLTYLARASATDFGRAISLPSLCGEAKRAAECMLVHNQRLVWDLARHFNNGAIPLEDLAQHGSIGLIRAVEKFDPSRGLKFSTYATHWIRQAITRALANEGRLIRLPVHVVEDVNRIEKFRREFEMNWGRLPNDGEIANQLQFPIAKVKQLRIFNRDVLSLDTPFEDNGATLGELLIRDEAPSAFEQVSVDALSMDIRSVLDTLSDREAGVIRARFGFDENEPLTLDEIGQRYGVTRERIRQIQVKALKKLRHPSRAKVLAEWSAGGEIPSGDDGIVGDLTGPATDHASQSLERYSA